MADQVQPEVASSTEENAENKRFLGEYENVNSYTQVLVLRGRDRATRKTLPVVFPRNYD